MPFRSVKLVGNKGKDLFILKLFFLCTNKVNFTNIYNFLKGTFIQLTLHCWGRIVKRILKSKKGNVARTKIISKLVVQVPAFVTVGSSTIISCAARSRQHPNNPRSR